MPYLLWLGHKPPVDQRLIIVWIGTGIEARVARHGTSVAIVDLVEASCFNNCNTDSRVGSKSRSDGESSSASADYHIVEGGIGAGETECASQYLA